ncbi:hypothetical protein QA597_04720 [Marinilabiliaceae bacterium ANBcel2]|nr:hypothetical protein [Marinilabiliaceae bacterium ANBcel2]
MNNLDFNDENSYTDPNNLATFTTGNGWSPVLEFNGILDDNGYSINNLFIDMEKIDEVGLFGSTMADAQILNLGLENVNIKGEDGVGALIGVNNGGYITN